MLTRSKLNSIESNISEALINSEISHEDFTRIINKGKNYRQLKESIGMINKGKNYRQLKESIGMIKTLRSNTQKNYLIEEDRRKGVNEIIRQNA